MMFLVFITIHPLSTQSSARPETTTPKTSVFGWGVAAAVGLPSDGGRGHGKSIPNSATNNHHYRDDLGRAPVSGMIWNVRRARREGIGMYDCNKQSHAWRDRVCRYHLSDLTTLAQDAKSSKGLQQHCV